MDGYDLVVEGIKRGIQIITSTPRIYIPLLIIIVLGLIIDFLKDKK